MKIYINAEKTLYDKGLKPQKETKNNFIKKYWNKSKDLNGISKKERNDFEHEIDDNLLHLTKF